MVETAGRKAILGDTVVQALVCEALTGVGGVRMCDIERPAAGPGEVVIKVVSAGINYRDLLMQEGRYQIGAVPPFVAGCEVGGRISEIGKGVTGWSLGEPVVAHVGNGGFAEYVVCPVDRLGKLPAHLTIAAAGALTVGHSTGLLAIEKIARLEKGQRLLVLGATGATGFAAVEIALALGLDVTAVTRTVANAELVEKICGCKTIAADVSDLQQWLLSQGGFHCVFDTLGGDYSAVCSSALLPGGTHLVVGFAAGEIPSLSLSDVSKFQTRIAGVSWGGWVQGNRNGQQAIYRRLFDWWSAGKIMNLPVVEMPLSEFHQAFEAVKARRQPAKFCLIP